MKAYELTSWLEKKYPSDAAEDWDNVGLLAGDDTNEISHVFLALDLTEETLAEAIEDGAAGSGIQKIFYGTLKTWNFFPIQWKASKLLPERCFGKSPEFCGSHVL